MLSAGRYLWDPSEFRLDGRSESDYAYINAEFRRWLTECSVGARILSRSGERVILELYQDTSYPLAQHPRLLAEGEMPELPQQYVEPEPQQHLPQKLERWDPKWIHNRRLAPITCVSTFVMAVQEREAHARCFRSIDDSDINRSYAICRHPEGLTPNEHWLATHRRASRARTDFVLMLEDDVLVNRHILHNIVSWRWPRDPNFAAGWLYNPGGYSSKDVWYEGGREWHGTCAVLYRTDSMGEIIGAAWELMKAGMKWDLAVSSAAHNVGRIRAHFPSLVEHLEEYPSVVGSTNGLAIRTSRGTFDADWRRPERHEHGLLDEYGRSQI